MHRPHAGLVFITWSATSRIAQNIDSREKKIIPNARAWQTSSRTWVWHNHMVFENGNLNPNSFPSKSAFEVKMIQSCCLRQLSLFQGKKSYQLNPQIENPLQLPEYIPVVLERHSAFYSSHNLKISRNIRHELPFLDHFLRDLDSSLEGWVLISTRLD